MGDALRQLLPKLRPELREFEHWMIINHQGKSDLEKSYPRKMKQWGEPGVRFIIMRDNDGADCVALKARLASRMPDNPPTHLIRIVCQELESWFIGDMRALKAAYPAAGRHQTFKTLANTHPDTLTNASDLLKVLTGTKAKRLTAELIAQHMKPAVNRSGSFQIFVAGLDRLAAA